MRTEVRRSFYKSGQLAVEYSLRGGSLNGLFREWQADGRLTSEQVYEMGKPQLIRQFSRRTGRLYAEIVSRNYLNHQRFWNRTTRKWNENYVLHGKEISRKQYLSLLKG